MDIKKLYKAYKAPFVCDNESAMVVDQDNNAVIVVRGWSRLNKVFAENEAFEFQLQMAHFIANKLNECTEFCHCEEKGSMDRNGNCRYCGGTYK